MCALAALKDATFPKYNKELDKIEYKEKTTKKLDLNQEPVSITVIKVGDTFIVDPITDEEKVIEARLTVASLKDGTLCALQKGGDYAFLQKDIDKMIDIALEKAKELRGAL